MENAAQTMLPLGLSHAVIPWPVPSIVGPTAAVVVAAAGRVPVGAAAVETGAGTVTMTVAVVGVDGDPTSPQPESRRRTAERESRPETFTTPIVSQWVAARGSFDDPDD
jgi:hypothetical protein